MVKNFIKKCQISKGNLTRILILDSGLPTNNELTDNVIYDKTLNLFETPYYEKYIMSIPYIHKNKRFLYEKENNKDQYDHQTNIISIISSKLLGVSPESKIICCKILNKHGKGPITLILEGLIYANKINPDIVNISTGYTLHNITKSDEYRTHDRIYEEIIKLYKKNIPVICSRKKEEHSSFYPADFNETISVSDDNSNTDFTSDYVYEKTSFFVHTNRNDYKIKSGSSFMTAFITGIISNYITYSKINNSIVNIKTIKKELVKNIKWIPELYTP